MTGLFLLGAFTPNRVREQTQAVALATASPATIPSPTLDIQAAQAQQTALTNAQVDLARITLSIEQTNLAIQESKEREAQAIAAAAASEAEKFANNLRIIEAQNAQIELLARSARLDNEKIALENKSAELAIRQIEAQAAARNGWMVLAGAGLIGGGMIFIGRAISNPHLKAEPEPEPESEQSEPDTQTVQIAHPESCSSIYEHNIRISPAERATLRRAIIELRGVLSRRRLNGENESKITYFSEQRAEQILAELRRENANGVSLAVFGPNSMTLAMPQLYQWLGLPSPPLNKISPESTENAAKSRPTPPHPSGAEPKNTEGEGGKPEEDISNAN